MAIEPVRLSQIKNMHAAMKREIPAAVINLAAYLKALPKSEPNENDHDGN